MNYKELIKCELEMTYAIADNLMSKVDESQLDWKPSQENNWMTMGQLLHHLSNACGMPIKGFVTGDWGMPEGECVKDMKLEDMLPPAERLPKVESVAEARQLLAEDKTIALQMVEQSSEDDLANQNTVAPWGGPDMPLGQRMLSMVDHLNIHRAQLFYYLKLQGQPVNTMHMWGMG